MLTFLLITGIISGILTYITYKEIDYGDNGLRRTILNLLSFFILRFGLLTLPFVTIYFSTFMLDGLWAMFVFGQTYLITATLPKGLIQYEGKPLIVVVLVYFLIYLPYLTIYCLRFLPLTQVILYTLAVMLIPFLIALLLKLIKNKKYLANHAGIFSFILIITLTITLYKVGIPTTYNDGSEERSIDSFHDYYSTNVLKVYDGTENADLVSYYYDEQYLYYIIEHPTHYLEIDSFSLKVYDYQNDTTIFTHDFESEKIEENSFIKENNTLYCLLDDVYMYENQGVTKVLETNDGTIYSFTYNDGNYIQITDLNQNNKFYSFSDTFSETDIFKDVANLSIFKGRLVIEENEDIRYYDNSLQTSFSTKEFKPILLTDTAVLYRSSDHSMFLGGSQYTIKNINSNTSTSFIVSHVNVAYNLGSGYSTYYSYSERSEVSLGDSYILLDENLNKLGTYDTTMFNKDYDEYIIPKIKVINDSIVYGVQNEVDEDNSKLYFEINELHKQNFSILQNNNIYVEPFTYLYTLPILVLTLIFASYNLKQIKGKNKTENDENSEEENEKEE